MSATIPSFQEVLQERADALVTRTASVLTAAGILWKYTDEEGQEFYLADKRMGTIRSPYSGKSFTAKPERSSLTDVGKELKEEGAKVKGALFKYEDEDGNEFYLPKRVTGPLKSPTTGKSFTAKPDKSSLNDVGKELKDEKKEEPSK